MRFPYTYESVTRETDEKVLAVLSHLYNRE